MGIPLTDQRVMCAHTHIYRGSYTGRLNLPFHVLYQVGVAKHTNVTSKQICSMQLCNSLPEFPISYVVPFAHWLMFIPS